MSVRHNRPFRHALIAIILGPLFGQSCAPAELKELDNTQYQIVRKTLEAPREFAFQRDPTDLPYLAQALSDTSIRIRTNAARDLAAMGREAAPARQAIETCSNDHASGVRSHCRKALTNIGGTAQTVASQEQKVVIATQSAVTVPAGSLPVESSIPTPTNKKQTRAGKEIDIATANQIAENALRHVARKRLEASEPATVSSWITAQGYLRDRLANGTSKEQEVAAETLRHQSAYLVEALESLRESLNHPDSKIRARIILALGECRDASSVPALSQLIADESVQSEAIWALEQIGTPEAIKALKKAGFTSTTISKAPAVRTRPGFSARQVRDVCLVKVREARVDPEDLYIEECVRRAAEYY